MARAGPLHARDASGYTLTFWDGTRYDLERVGDRYALVRVSDRYGNAITLRYLDGHLHDGTDSAGRVLRFVMKGPRLLSVHVPHNGERHTLVRYAYHDDGYLAEATDPGGHAMRYEYKDGRLVKETKRNGVSFYFEYDAGGYCTRTWGDGGIYERRLVYHKYGFTCQVHDGRGGMTSYIGNGSGLVEREIDQEGTERWYEWDFHCRKVAEMDAHKNRTEWEYDERGNIVVERDPYGRETLFTYNALNVPVEMTDAAGATWRWIYDGRGKLVKEIDPLEGVTRFRHDRRGLLTRVEGPTGRTLSLEYDAYGNLTSGGYVFDDLGRMVREPEAKLALDTCGRVARIDRSDGAWMRFKRDAEGLVIEREDERGYTWRYAYTTMGKLAVQIDPEGCTVQLGYDSDEHLTSVTNAHGKVYQYVRDRAGRVRQEIGFDKRVTKLYHDQAGYLIRVMGSRWLAIERDKLGRIAKLEMPGRARPGNPVPETEVVTYEYDARGDLVRAKNGSAVVVFVRDALGRVVEERQGDVRIERGYDPAGAFVLRRTSLGHEARFAWDGDGELEAVSFDHDPRFGNFAPESLRASAEGLRAPWKATLRKRFELELPGGVTSRWKRDQFARPLAHLVRMPGGDMGRRYRWKSAEEIGAFESFDGPDLLTFHHDRCGTLVSVLYPNGAMAYRNVDAVGNVFGTSRGEDRLYGLGGRLLVADGVRFEYDTEGQLVARELRGGARWGYVWDALGQLVEAIRPEGMRVSFAYDALGRRVSKTAGGKTTRFIWDGDELIHELVEGAPLVTWVWEPGTFTLIAKAEGDKRYGVVADHLGVPMIFTDEQGGCVWSGELDVWGSEFHDVAKIDNPWRFPGQYEDEETGFYYNRFRYYDPHAGQYISQDPLGLGGGLGLYAYVRDPLTWIDPLGLSCKKGVGPYSKVGGHHIHAKAAFRGHPFYDVEQAIATGRDYMMRNSIVHERITLAQRRLFKGLVGSRNALTLTAHSEVAQEALERFGRTLVERVRDGSISDCEMIVDGRAKALALANLYARLGALNEEQRMAIHELIVKCVDITIHHPLWMLDQEKWINVAVDTDTGTVPSLREISDGLIGDKFEWIEQFSNKPQPI
jgi:RHS repeat-associated protein